MNIKDDFILSQIDEGYLVGGSVRDALMGKSFVDRDIVIKKTTNRHKAMTMVQELSGKNLLDCDNHLLQSMYYGEALFADLNPGFKEFITKALELNGVSEFRKSR